MLSGSQGLWGWTRLLFSITKLAFILLQLAHTIRPLKRVLRVVLARCLLTSCSLHPFPSHSSLHAVLSCICISQRFLKTLLKELSWAHSVISYKYISYKCEKANIFFLYSLNEHTNHPSQRASENHTLSNCLRVWGCSNSDLLKWVNLSLLSYCVLFG